MAFDKSRNGKHGVGGFHAVTVTVGDAQLRPFVLQPENGTRIHIVVKPDGALMEGDVLLPRWREWDDADPRKRELRHSRYRDLFSAHRGTLHAIFGYEPENGSRAELGGSIAAGELEKMLTARDTALDVLAYMRAVRRLEPADVQHLRTRIIKLVEALERSRLPKKQEAYAQFAKSMALRDRKGRRNVGALCARMVAGLRRINGRVDDICSIAPRLALQLMVLEQELTLHYRTCIRVEKTLRNVLQECEHFECGPRTDPRQTVRIDTALDRLIGQIKIFHAEPFLSLRRQITDNTLAAKVARHEGQVEMLRQALESARYLTVLMIERVELGAIHRDLSLLDKGRLPEEISKEIKSRLGRFTSRMPELKGIEGLPYEVAARAAGDCRKTLKNGLVKDAKQAIAQLVAALEMPFKFVPETAAMPQSAATH